MNIGIFAEQTIETEEARERETTAAAYRILVVDDEESMRAFTVDALTFGGYHTDAAEGGTVALKVLKEGHYDLVLTDFNMPNGSGMDLIMKMQADGLMIPVILMTGAALTKELLALTSMLHVGKILQKPFGIEDLLVEVEKILRHRHDMADLTHAVTTGSSEEILRAAKTQF